MRGVEDYLGQIKRLEEDGERCTATLLAQTLKVSLPSASQMLKRLTSEGFVERRPDASILLTEQGRPVAHKVLRRHRVIERLLTDVLGMPWHEVHAEAHRLEHAVSASVEEHLMQKLGFPEYCPHGHPICPVDRRHLRPLNTAEPGEEVAIGQLSEIKEELLLYFDQIGLRPTAIFKVRDVGAFGGPISMLTEAGSVSISREVAAYVQVCDPEEADWLGRTSA